MLAVSATVKVPVSDLADEFGVQPSLIHNWVNQLLSQVERAFDRPSGKRRQEEAEARKIAFLEAKLAGKNEVIAELMQEHVQLKRGTWGSLKEQWVPHDTRDEVVD